MASRIVIDNPPGLKGAPVVILAQAILDMSRGIKQLREGALNDRALVLLIQHASPRKVSAKTVRAVLEGIEGLAETYLKKQP